MPLPPPPRPTPRLPSLALALCCAAGVQAAPVDGQTDLSAPDPYELAVRWTLASLSPAAAAREPAPVVPAAPALPSFSALPQAAAQGGVPAPGAYALMGLVLLGAGLAARRLGRRQRGFSKKT